VEEIFISLFASLCGV